LSRRLGSISYPIGYSGEDSPRMYAPSAVGILEFEGKKEYYVDDMLHIRRDKMAVSQITDRNGYST